MGGDFTASPAPLDDRALRIIAGLAAGAKRDAETMERDANDDDPEPSVARLREMVGTLVAQVMVLADCTRDLIADRALVPTPTPAVADALARAEAAERLAVSEVRAAALNAAATAEHFVETGKVLVWGLPRIAARDAVDLRRAGELVDHAASLAQDVRALAGQLARAEGELCEARGRIDVLERALYQAAGVFDAYALMHAAKDTHKGQRKAYTNAEHATRIRKALDAALPARPSTPAAEGENNA